MGIYKRESGIYYMQAAAGGQVKRISLETKNKALAQEIYQAYLLDKIKQKLGILPLPGSSESPTPKPPKHSLKPVYIEYLEACTVSGFGTHTMGRKRKMLEIFIKQKIKHVDELNQKTLNKLFDLWADTPKDTVIKHIANIKAFLNYCIKKRLYDRADYETLTFPKLKVNVRDTVIPEKDYQKLLQAATGVDFALYLQTLWETGCRPNELIRLKKEDIDFSKGIAKIYQPKTKKYKTSYLPDELLEKLRLIRKTYIFEGIDKQPEYYAKLFKTLRESLKMPKEYCLYAFRHSFGTRILNKTKDLHLVSKLLGHADISVTARHYINRSDDEIRKQLLEAEK